MTQALEGEHSRAALTESVDGCAHQSAVDIIGALEQQRDMLLEVLKANEAFITEMVTFGGKYSFLSGTDIIPDAYAQLKQISVAIAAVEWEK